MGSIYKRGIMEVSSLAIASERARPFLVAIADSLFQLQVTRDWLIKGTPVEQAYIGAAILWDEQKAKRWRSRPTKQPFWANYWCGRDSKCTCRIPGSKGLESDAIFFLRNSSNRVLAVHVEFKHAGEPFGFGQPESYPLRAACFAKTWETRKTLNEHHDWVTVIFCDRTSVKDPRIAYFQRIIPHDEASSVIENYPKVH